jgi:hypothetical protein
MTIYIKKKKEEEMTCDISCETGYPSAIRLLTSLFATSNSPDLQAASSDLTTSSGIT